MITVANIQIALIMVALMLHMGTKMSWSGLRVGYTVPLVNNHIEIRLSYGTAKQVKIGEVGNLAGMEKC